MTKQFKTYASRVKATGNDREFEFIIATESPDRDHDRILTSGWRLDNYKKNPVVQWAHDYHSLPVGFCTRIGPRGDKLIARARIATATENPMMGEPVYQMLSNGLLSATSVGFNPIKFNFNPERNGTDFIEHELLEFSIVPVPANPEALIQMRALGLDKPIIKWAKRVLKGNYGLPNVPLPSLGDGIPTHPFGRDDEHLGGPFANPRKDEQDEEDEEGTNPMKDEQDDEDEQGTKPPVYGRSRKRRKEEEEDEEDRLDIDEQDSRRKLRRLALRLLREVEEEEEEEEEERKLGQRPRVRDLIDIDDDLIDEDDLRLEDEDAEGDPLLSPSGVTPIGPKALAQYAEKFGLPLRGVGKRVAVCPKGPECPHKANQAIEHCPAKRDCPLIWNAQHHPGEGQAMPIGWMPVDLRVNPRTSFDHSMSKDPANQGTVFLPHGPCRRFDPIKGEFS